jgi:hypothetical protein
LSTESSKTKPRERREDRELDEGEETEYERERLESGNNEVHELEELEYRTLPYTHLHLHHLPLPHTTLDHHPRRSATAALDNYPTPTPVSRTNTAYTPTPTSHNPPYINHTPTPHPTHITHTPRPSPARAMSPIRNQRGHVTASKHASHSTASRTFIFVTHSFMDTTLHTTIPYYITYNHHSFSYTPHSTTLLLSRFVSSSGCVRAHTETELSPFLSF